jgi:hypothetical protein
VADREFDNNRRGALWNGRGKHPKAPHFEGDCELDGQRWRVEMWENEPQGKRPIFSLRFKPWEEHQAEIERWKAEKDSRGDAPRARGAQVDRPRHDPRPPLQREEPPPFEDDDSWL